VLHTFLSNNRNDLIARCRAKVASRPARDASEQQLENGVPLFLDQLITKLKIEQTDSPLESRLVSGPADGNQAFSAIGGSAASNGHELLKLGFTVDQVVHDYGDLCQAITDLAQERDAPFSIDEFRTLNRCLDNAIADAVTEFSYRRDFIVAGQHAAERPKDMGRSSTNSGISFTRLRSHLPRQKPEAFSSLVQLAPYWNGAYRALDV